MSIAAVQSCSPFLVSQFLAFVLSRGLNVSHIRRHRASVCFTFHFLGFKCRSSPFFHTPHDRQNAHPKKNVYDRRKTQNTRSFVSFFFTLPPKANRTLYNQPSLLVVLSLWIALSNTQKPHKHASHKYITCTYCRTPAAAYHRRVAAFVLVRLVTPPIPCLFVQCSLGSLRFE